MKKIKEKDEPREDKKSKSNVERQHIADESKKVEMQVDSWFRRFENQSVVNCPVRDQGPHEFRKILRPTSVAKSDFRDNDLSSSAQFDFRKLLRKTNHAPTDSLRKCKGLQN
ncbi:hypothetical protein B4U80_01545 [Leptotrombidium deliense]|uniref:Uncharacterized protein n=1 Tax=Leptotrombidium deliense TaxID=299467 RepID=A0A443SK32_9ACAR|nr:hypothetical protein B4U80_01545 [Leptotrombidium deliense]